MAWDVRQELVSTCEPIPRERASELGESQVEGPPEELPGDGEATGGERKWVSK